ncbi:MAG: adenylyltransferase/cytidyltransferase family protein [Myxococcota bacterium]
MTQRARDKIFVKRRLADRLVRDRRGGRRVVFTNGCFDLLHVGHLRSLEQARSLGDILIVGVNRDRRARELKGAGRPVVVERQRAELVAGLRCVDYVVLFGEDTPAPLIRALRPDIVAKGGEYRGGDAEEKGLIESLGGQFVYLRQVPGIRSTHLVERARRSR